jgi:MSHA biogenesis protein MshI
MLFFANTKKNPGWMAIGLRNDGICAAHVRRPPKGKPVVELAAFYPCEPASVRPTLEKMAKDLGVSRYRCAALLASGQYQMLLVDAPNVPSDELKTAIRWRLKDMVDFHVEDATIDLLDIPVDKQATVRNHSMYAVVAHNQVIREAQTVLCEAKVPLSVIDIPEMAQRNVSSMLGEEGRGLAFLSFTGHDGLLTVTYASELYLSRRIDISLSQLQQVDEERRNACFERITLELQRSLDHFDRQYHFITISRLVLSPLGEAGSRLRDYLSSNLYVPVEMLELEAVFDLSKTPDLRQPELQQRYFMMLGACLRQEESVQ